MSISQYEMYHGAVLAQVVRKPKVSLKLFERKPRHDWSRYDLEDNKKNYTLFVKATKNIHGKRVHYGNFTFSLDDIHSMRGIKSRELMVCLVCGNKEICMLDRNDLEELGILNRHSQCGVNVSWQDGTELSVKCGGHKLSHKIPRNRLKDYEWQV